MFVGTKHSAKGDRQRGRKEGTVEEEEKGIKIRSDELRGEAVDREEKTKMGFECNAQENFEDKTEKKGVGWRKEV